MDLCQIHRQDMFGPSLRRVFNVKVKGQGHQGLPSPPAAMEWNVLAANNVMQQQMGPFRCCQGGDFGGLRAICLVKHL